MKAILTSLKTVCNYPSKGGNIFERHVFHTFIFFYMRNILYFNKVIKNYKVSRLTCTQKLHRPFSDQSRYDVMSCCYYYCCVNVIFSAVCKFGKQRDIRCKCVVILNVWQVTVIINRKFTE